MGCSQSNFKTKIYPGIFYIAIAPVEVNDGAEQAAKFVINALAEDAELTSTVELSMSCVIQENHNCMLVFYSDEEDLQEIGRTEIQKSTSCPHFITTFCVAYSFEKQKRFRFDMYGMSNSNLNSLLRQTPLGSAKFNIHEIVSAPNHLLTKPISKGGTISVYSEDQARMNNKITLTLGVQCKISNGIYSIRVVRASKDRDTPIYITEGLNGIPCRNSL